VPPFQRHSRPPRLLPPPPLVAALPQAPQTRLLAQGLLARSRAGRLSRMAVPAAEETEAVVMAAPVAAPAAVAAAVLASVVLLRWVAWMVRRRSRTAASLSAATVSSPCHTWRRAPSAAPRARCGHQALCERLRACLMSEAASFRSL
jgi:hypothetical protein